MFWCLIYSLYSVKFWKIRKQCFKKDKKNTFGLSYLFRKGTKTLRRYIQSLYCCKMITDPDPLARVSLSNSDSVWESWFYTFIAFLVNVGMIGICLQYENWIFFLYFVAVLKFQIQTKNRVEVITHCRTIASTAILIPCHWFEKRSLYHYLFFQSTFRYTDSLFTCSVSDKNTN